MNDVKKKLSDNAMLIEKALDEYYTFKEAPSLELIEAQRYALLQGGKRIRAFLVLQTCELFGVDKVVALPYACAIEMLHASSLVHDDLPCMDNDDFRRGKPSTHKMFDESIALLAGDALMVKAFETIATNPHLPNSTNAIAVSILASSAGAYGMLAGQAVDLKASNEKLDLETIHTLHNLKTARLVCASVKLGCLAAGVNEHDNRYNSLINYANNIGLAFQIIDDLLEYESGKKELNSFLSFMSAEEARAYSHKLTQNAISEIQIIDNGTFEDLANHLIYRKY